MRMLRYCVILATGLAGCSDDGPTPGSGLPGGGSSSGGLDWLVPVDEVFDGGPGKDGIPALEDPEMVSASEGSYLSESELVVGFKSGSDVRAYPHVILDWHEIINDTYPDQKLAITYCPLTGSATAWDATINGQPTTFGVSGLLYQTNLMPYDRLTNSTWSQMRLDCVNGELIGVEAQTYQVVETTWSTWKEMYPETKVNSMNTGFSRDYQRYPYVSGNQDYRTSNSFFLFPFSPNDNRLPAKDRVLGVIIGEEVKVYPIANLEDRVTVIEDSFMGTFLVIVGDRTKNFIVAFESNTGEGPGLQLSAVQDRLPVVMEDTEGNEWSIFGEALSGPRTGARLKSTRSLIGYWFTFGSFYPTPEIFGEDS